MRSAMLAAPQQQQQQRAVLPSGSAPASPAWPSLSRYTLLSCFRELPSVNTAPPAIAISIAQGAAAADSEAQRGPPSSSGASLADVPAEVMSQLLRLLSARDLASLALTCRGLRAAAWEAVPGLQLVLYPHQRNALSWMLHREVHGGGPLTPHPCTKVLITGGGDSEDSEDFAGSGLPFYADQVRWRWWWWWWWLLVRGCACGGGGCGMRCAAALFTSCCAVPRRAVPCCATTGDR
jgi:hypothetical protein